MIILGIGELLWDCFDGTRRPGGAPANLAYHAQLLGNRGRVCSRIGHDAPGVELRQVIRDNGLADELLQVDPEHPTGRVTVDRSDPAQPRFIIHPQVAWDFLEFSDAWQQGAAEVDAICFGTLAQRALQSRRTIQRLIAETDGVLRVCDFNLRPPWYSPEVIDFCLRHADVLKLNAEEVLTVCGYLDVPLKEQALLDWLAMNRGDTTLCITRGAEGCSILQTARPRVDLEAEPVEVVDPVGCGDAFTAAFIHGTLQGWSTPVTARFANRVGAVVAAHEGAMPDVGRDYRELLAAGG